MQNADVSPSLHTFRCMHAHSNDPTLNTCRFAACSKHRQVTHLLRGLARDVQPPADPATNLWAQLTTGASYSACLIRPCLFLVQAPRGSPGLSPALSLSPSSKLSTQHSLPLSEKVGSLAYSSL